MSDTETLRFLDPEQIARVWFRSAAGAVQVSWDNGQTWDTLANGTDDQGNAAQYIRLVGPDVDPAEIGDDTDSVVLAMGDVQGMSRVKHNPQITPRRWVVTVTKTPAY